MFQRCFIIIWAGSNTKNRLEAISKCWKIHIVIVLSLNNSVFGDYIDRIYPIELEINDIIYTATVKEHKVLEILNMAAFYYNTCWLRHFTSVVLTSCKMHTNEMGRKSKEVTTKTKELIVRLNREKERRSYISDLLDIPWSTIDSVVRKYGQLEQ